MAKKTHYGCLIAVWGVAAALYLNSLWGQFVFDDHEAIENNPDVRSNTPLSEVFQNDFWGQRLSDPESHKSFRPLTTLSFRLNRLLHGMWPPGFHLFNLLCHSLVSSLLCLLCLRLKLSLSASLVCSLLFASHPVHTEAVANIVGRTELLSGIFFLLSLLSYPCCLNHKRGKGANKYSHQEPLNSELLHAPPTHFSWLWLTSSVLLAAVSMLCKEQGITVLGVCLAYDLFVACGKDPWEFFVVLKQTVVDVLLSREDNSKKRGSLWQKSFLMRVIIVVLAAVTLLFIRFYLNGGDPPLFVESDNPASFSPHLSTRFFTYVHLVVLNLWLLVCPSCLCFDWSMGSIPLVQSASDIRNLWSVVVAVLLVAFLFVAGLSSTDCSSSSLKDDNTSKVAADSNGNFEELGYKANVKQKRDLQLKENHRFKHKPREKQLSLFALSLLILPFLPASNLLFPVGFVLAERVLYLPSLGICLLVAVGIDKLQLKIGRGMMQQALTLTISLLVLLYSVKTFKRNLDWGNSLSLAESAVPVNPSNAKVFMTIGNHYAQKGNRRCELFYRQALQLRPNYTAAWTNLGLVLLNTDRAKEAEDCYCKALSIKADHINANTNMAHLCRIQERWEEAVTYYSTALRRRPKNPLLHYYLGFVYERLGSAEGRQNAEQEYGIAIEQHPGHWESHISLARLLSTTTSNGVKLQRGYTKGKRMDKAILHYRRALQFKPNDDGAHFELGKLLFWKGLPLEAKKELTIALQLNPKNVGAHLELGNTLELLGEREQAMGELRKALELDPSLQLAKQKLEELQIRL